MPNTERRGIAALFIIAEPATGRCAVRTRLRRTAADFAEVLAYISDVMYPDAEEITIVLDPLNTHTLRSLRKRYSEFKAARIAGRIRLVHTPVHESCLNLKVNQISILSRQYLTRHIADIKTLRTKMRIRVRTRNAAPKPTMWKFSKEKAREKLPQMYPEQAAA